MLITSTRYLHEAQRLREESQGRNMRVARSPQPLQFIRQFDVSINLSLLSPVDPNFR